MTLTLSEEEKIFTQTAKYKHLKMLYENLNHVKRRCYMRGETPSEELVNSIKSLRKQMTDELYGYIY